jgi:hypothetical protein
LSYSVFIILTAVCGGARADNQTAKTLGITFPESLTVSADEIIGAWLRLAASPDTRSFTQHFPPMPLAHFVRNAGLTARICYEWR